MKNALTAMLILSGCATIHPGKPGSTVEGQQENLPLKISAYTPDKSLGRPFQLVEVTFENTSVDWLRVNRARVIIDNPGETKLSIVTGSDLRDWATAMNEVGKIDEHNESLLKSSALLVGAAVSGSDDSGVATAGAIAALGAYGWIVSDVIVDAKNLAERSEKVPTSHLYSTFSVPGKMFLRKWVLFNKPATATITKVILEVETVENKKEMYAISL
jgi:hypothetical protein